MEKPHLSFLVCLSFSFVFKAFNSPTEMLLSIISLLHFPGTEAATTT